MQTIANVAITGSSQILYNEKTIIVLVLYTICIKSQIFGLQASGDMIFTVSVNQEE
jgi:hypothetical protein